MKNSCLLVALATGAFGLAPQPQVLRPSLVVTGGPCSGKTTAIEALPGTLAGYKLIKVPEAATLYFDRGGRVPFGAPADAAGVYAPEDRNLLWEAWLVELKISLENAAHAAGRAALSPGHPGGAERTALVCDRGIFDSRAYLGDGAVGDAAWGRLLGLGGWDEGGLLARYSAVACLDVAPEDHYGRGNAARRETFAEARLVHARTWAAWHGAAARAEHRLRGRRADFTAEFALGGGVRGDDRGAVGGSSNLSNLWVPSPVLITNPQDAPGAEALFGASAAGDGDEGAGVAFSSKVAALQRCVEGCLEDLGAGGQEQPSPSSAAAAAAGFSASGFSMPLDFVVQQADAVASALNLGGLVSGGSPASGGGRVSILRHGGGGSNDGGGNPHPASAGPAGCLYERSLALLRDLQLARQGDPARRRGLMLRAQELGRAAAATAAATAAAGPRLEPASSLSGLFGLD